MRLLLTTSPATARAEKPRTERGRERTMEQKLSVLLSLVLLCAVSGDGLRVLQDVDTEYGREFAFGSKAAAGAETTPQDPSFDDYENEISRVEFEPELGTSYAAAAVAPGPGPSPEPVTVGSAARATGTSSMKWWLPPSTMPSSPLFPNPGGMPGMGMPMPDGIPGMPMPGVDGMPGMPFKPIGWGAAPAPPGQAQPTPPAAAAAEANDNLNPNEVVN